MAVLTGDWGGAAMTPDYLAAQQYARPMVMRILHSREDTEDVLQDATVKAITKLGSFRGDSQFNTWFCRIAIYTALMRLRWQRTRGWCDLPDDLPLPREQEPDSIAIALERKERLLAAASTLTPTLRDEFSRYLRGETTRNSDRVKSSRFRIRNKLRAALAGMV